MKNNIKQRGIYIIALLLIFNCSGNFVFGQSDTIKKTEGSLAPPLPPPLPPVDCFFSYRDEMPVWLECVNEDKKEERQCQGETLTKIIQENLEYPEEALLYKITGTAIVTFVIKKDGSASNFKTVRDIGYGTKEEALRLVQLMCGEGVHWKPGLQRGRAINIQFNMPVKFSLEE